MGLQKVGMKNLEIWPSKTAKYYSIPPILRGFWDESKIA